MMPVLLHALLGRVVHLFLSEACFNLHTWKAVLINNMHDDLAPASTIS